MKTSLMILVFSCSISLGQSVYVKQIPGKKFIISGSGQLKDSVVVVSGVANGISLVGSAGEFSIGVKADFLGDVTVKGNNGSIATVTLSNNSPVFVSLSSIRSGNTITLSGSISDESPNGLFVTFYGPSGINGNVAKVFSDGTFSVTFIYSGQSTTISADVIDWYGAKASKSVLVP